MEQIITSRYAVGLGSKFDCGVLACVHMGWVQRENVVENTNTKTKQKENNGCLVSLWQCAFLNGNL